MKNHNISSARFARANDTHNVIAITDDGIEITTHVNSDVQGGMVAYLAGGGTISTYVPPVLTKDDLKSYAADVRWQKETAGTVVGGIAIPTDDRAKVLLLGAATSMAADATAKYIVGNTSVTLTGTQFAAFYAGLVAHVQACFETQDVVISQIDAGTITTKAEIDGAFA